jgi:hypothetical protein
MAASSASARWRPTGRIHRLIVAVDLPWKVQDTLGVLRGHISAIDPFERVYRFGSVQGLWVAR